MLTFEQYLLTEMPKHYPGNISYMKDSKFTPISVRNISDYHVLADHDGLLYVVHPQQTFGFVFDLVELKSGKSEILPVMRVSLRDTNIKGYKQAHFLRIREAFSKTNIVKNWYLFYLDKFGGIVSDTEHLEGGKLLWQSLIKTATTSRGFTMTLYSLSTAQPIKQITVDTPIDDIWSTDDSKKDLVLVLEYA